MFTNICRICLGQDLLSSIFNKRGSTMISTTIMTMAKIYISPNDGLPNTICIKCIQKLDNCIEFIQLCERSDSELRLQKDEEEINKTSAQVNTKHVSNSLSPKSETEKCLILDENVSAIQNENIMQFEGDQKLKIQNKKGQKQQCSTCGKVMSSRTHTGERPFVCSHCNKKFSLAQNLKVHLRVHTGEKPHLCTVCGESFAQTAGLAAHRRKHTGQMPYHCVLCPRSFRTVGHLQYHVRRHTGEKNFDCEACGRAFVTRSELKQHVLTHSGEKPHVCCHCGVRLSRASHLKRHILHLHKVKKRFRCEKCSSMFDEKEDLEKHKKLHVKAAEE
ncbi:putative zinc finger protein 735 isoform X2 [Manduca sexta]|uniref:putative zinc finger protein 735 isoform X2 n=1 Tax=Manduca sexta TaxID=7130 RepID=UPI00188EF471|nr:putative zinc finger protein 735 isoform X2 [Manduca sexta]